MRGNAPVLVCVLLLVACGGQGGAGEHAHPDGWRAVAGGWVSQNDPRQRFSVTSAPRQSVTLADFGTKITIDTLLRHKGARLVRALPYPGCPGEAGLQSFIVPQPPEQQVLRVAYSTWTGNAVTASYTRPATSADDPAAVAALTSAVCSAVSGAPTLPPVGR